MLCFCLTQILFASVYCIKKNLDSRARLFKNLPDSQKFTNNQYIQQQLKQSLKPSQSISAFRSIVGNTKRLFTVLTFWFCTNCAARNLSHELTFQPIPRCCRNLEAKANMFFIIRASSQTQSNWKECSGCGSGSSFQISWFSIRPWIVLLLLSVIWCNIELK